MVVLTQIDSHGDCADEEDEEQCPLAQWHARRHGGAGHPVREVVTRLDDASEFLIEGLTDRGIGLHGQTNRESARIPGQ